MKCDSLFCLLVLVAGLMLAALGCSKRGTGGEGKASGVPSPARAARAVTVATVTDQVMERTVAVIGSLAAHNEATLSVKVPGRLETLPVDLGSIVHQGQLIAQVEPKDYELQLTQAEAMLSQARARLGLTLAGEDEKVDATQTSTVKEAKARLEEARKNRDRIVELNEQGILSQSERETADAAHEIAANRFRDALEEVNNRMAQLAQRRAEVEIARQQLADTAIRAPFDGVIQERRTSAGEYLIAGRPLVTIVQINPLRLRVEAPERESAAIRSGQKVRVWVEGNPAAHTGTISRVSPAIDRLTRMLVVEADIPNDDSLRAGSFVRAEIVTRDDQKSLSVPTDALVTFAGIEKVFVIEKDKAVERPVNIGRRGTNWVEVVNGVKSGDVVVLNPGNLQTGEAVKVQQPATTTARANDRS